MELGTGRLLVAAVGLAPANDVQYLQYTYDAIGNVATRENTDNVGYVSHILWG
jgi:hypothetical protein